MGRNYFGKCAICGKEGKLTFEHIPPRKAFNWIPVKSLRQDDVLKHISSNRLPWDFSEISHYDPHQKGSGDYTICVECNNNTGTWYGADYVSFVKLVHEEISKSKPVNSSTIHFGCRLYPLRVLKQAASMFCSVNNTNYGEVISELRSFVLDKTAQSFPESKAKIGMHGFIGGLPKRWGISALTNVSQDGEPRVDAISVIYHYPLGLVLYFNPDENTQIPGIDISFFNSYSYDQEVSLEIDLPCYEANTLFPLDYRTQNDVIRDTINAKLRQRR